MVNIFVLCGALSVRILFIICLFPSVYLIQVSVVCVDGKPDPYHSTQPIIMESLQTAAATILLSCCVFSLSGVKGQTILRSQSSGVVNVADGKWNEEYIFIRGETTVPITQ